MKYKLLLSIIILVHISAYGQFSQNISTDSTDIEIIRNSVYKIYEETYKNKDSVWYSVSYIKDTTQVNTEGWKTKSNKYLGTWKEYTEDGRLMYTWNHDKGICEVNKSLYPYHDLLQQMKAKADQLIISTYSKEFFENHVRFDYNCYAYDKDGYVGSWIEPLQRKPTKFLFRYSVKLNPSQWYEEMIGINLDSKGNYIPSHDSANNYGFEKVNGDKRTFQLDKTKAILLAKTQGLQTRDTNQVSEFLKWERFEKVTFYDGQFRYYISELTGEIKDIHPQGRSRIEYKYNVYCFNPWTGEFIEKKKMKRVREWEKNSGFTSGLIPDN